MAALSALLPAALFRSAKTGGLSLRRARLVVVICVGEGILSIPSLGAQEPPDTAQVTVDGIVVDGSTGNPLDNVLVRLPELGVNLLTDEGGGFALEGVALGTYRMIVSRVGFRVAEGEFTVEKGGSFVLPLWPTEMSPSLAPSRVSGRVVDRTSGEPISTATVSLSRPGLVRLTNTDGLFEFERVPPGSYSVTVEQLGFGTREDSLVVGPDQIVEMEIRLGVEPIAVEGIEVDVEARSRWLELEGFYGRLDHGIGRQFVRKQIEERDPLYLSDLLVTLPGLRVAREGFHTVVLSKRGVSFSDSDMCPLGVYVDGFLMKEFDLDMLDPRSVEALEVYNGTSETPIQYRTHCGVVLVWLRH